MPGDPALNFEDLSVAELMQAMERALEVAPMEVVIPAAQPGRLGRPAKTWYHEPQAIRR